MIVTLTYNPKTNNYSSFVQGVRLTLDNSHSLYTQRIRPSIEMSVMLTRPLYSRNQDRELDLSQDPYAYLVNECEENGANRMVEVEHKGFIKDFDTNQTVAEAVYGNSKFLLTPGRFAMGGVPVADRGFRDLSKNGKPIMPVFPGKAIVLLSDLGSRVVRMAGLPNLEDTEAHIKKTDLGWATYLFELNEWKQGRSLSNV